MTKKTNNGVRMIKERIKCNADMEELLSGSIDKIRQGLKDLEDTFGDSYDYLEIEFYKENDYEEWWTEIHLNGFRAETKEEEIIRLQREEKARERRLVQLEKDKKALDKKRADLLRKQTEITKELTKMGATP